MSSNSDTSNCLVVVDVDEDRVEEIYSSHSSESSDEEDVVDEVESPSSISSTPISPTASIAKPPGVGEYFVIKEGNISGICKLCRHVVQFKGVTSNLVTHLKRHHPKTYDDYFKKKEKNKRKSSGGIAGSSHDITQKVTSFFRPTTEIKKLSKSHPTQKRLTKYLLGTIAVDGLPLNIVEKHFFRQLLLEAEPRFAIPTRATITNTLIPIEKERIFRAIKEELSTVTRMHATVDIWSNRRMESFFGMTIHFVDKDFVLRKRVVAFNILDGRHTAENIAEAFDKVVSRYDIYGKIKHVVCDNASSMKKAFDHSLPTILNRFFANENQCEDEDDDVDDICQALLDDDDIIEPSTNQEELLSLCPKRISCFAHTLQLAVKDGLSAITPESILGKAIKKAMKMIASIRKSTQAAPLLQKSGINLLTANVTRWNSQVKSIRSLLAPPASIIKKAIATLGQLEQRRLGGTLNQTEVTALNELINILEPFEEATDLTQGDKVVTISSIVPAVVGLRQSLSGDGSPGESVPYRYAEALRIKLREACEARLEQFLTMDNKVAAVLDPNFRKSGLGRDVDSQVEDEIRRILRVELGQSSSASERDSGTPPGSPTKAKRTKLFAFMGAKPSSTENNASKLENEVMKEFDEYLKGDPTQDVPPLLFWKRKASKNGGSKLLSGIVRDSLGLTATSAPSERLFSIAGNIHREKRGHMSSTLLQRLTFLAANGDMF